jgi:hypothetical protein
VVLAELDIAEVLNNTQWVVLLFVKLDDFGEVSFGRDLVWTLKIMIRNLAHAVSDFNLDNKLVLIRFLE